MIGYPGSTGAIIAPAGSPLANALNSNADTVIGPDGTTYGPAFIQPSTTDQQAAPTTQTSVTPQTPQIFSTIPLTNTRTAIYMLSIRGTSPSKAAVQSYVFPISPSSISKEYMAMSNAYDTAGTPQQRGVQRSIDKYGSSPPTYTLSGTTGWQRHATDGFGLTGLQSIAALQALLATYDQLNLTQAQNNISALYTLELYDYFAGEYWQVEPVGRQVIEQDANRPLIFRYSFRLMAVQAITDAIAAPGPDPILSAFSVSASQAQSSLTTSTGNILASYASVTGGAQF